MALFLLLLNYIGFEFQRNTKTAFVLFILFWWLKQILYITLLNFRGNEFLIYLEKQRADLSKYEFKQFLNELREDFESIHPGISLYNGWVTVIFAFSMYILIPLFLILVNIN